MKFSAKTTTLDDDDLTANTSSRRSKRKPPGIDELVHKAGLCAAARLVARINPKGYVQATRPPDSVEDVIDDCDRVTSSIALKYVDPSCYALSYEDLCSVGRVKLAKMDHSGWFFRCSSRVEFFKVFKVSVKNAIKGLVCSHRGTAKRTGKTRNKDTNRFDDGMQKPIEVSLDDPDAHLQLGEAFEAGDMDANELYDDISVRLTDFDRMVLQQMVHPNAPARVLAEVDAYRAKKDGAVRIDLKAKHLAQGLGVTVEAFEEARKRIRDAAKLAMNESDTTSNNPAYAAAIAELCEIFSVDVPDSMRSNSGPADHVLAVRRLFTIAARARHELVDAHVTHLLRLIGARAPEPLQQGIFSCFGILFEEAHVICGACSLKQVCAAEAAQVGLGKMSVNPKIVGAAGSTRIPAILPNQRATVSTPSESTEVADAAETASTPPLSPPSDHVDSTYAVSERDVEIFAYLRETFKAARHQGLIYFKTRETAGNKYLVQLAPLDGSQSLRLKFTNPSPELEASLVRSKHRSFTLPANISAREAIRLIDQHATERYRNAS